MAALVKSCECCACESDKFSKSNRPWPQVPNKPCVCSFITPYNKKRFCIPPKEKNLKSVLEPTSGGPVGEMSKETQYNIAYVRHLPPEQVKRQSKSPKSELASQCPIETNTTNNTTYLNWNIKDAYRPVRCRRKWVWDEGPCENLTIYTQDFTRKVVPKTKNFRDPFNPAARYPMDHLSTNRADFVWHHSAYEKRPKIKEELKPLTKDRFLFTTVQKLSYLPNEYQTPQETPWIDYNKKVQESSKAQVSDYTTYNLSYQSPIPCDEEEPIIGDPCHGVCKCKKPGVCIRDIRKNRQKAK